MTVAALLLAAGESTRMGRPKALLAWGDTTLIEYQIGQLKQPPVDRVIVVLGHEAERIRPLAEQAGGEVLVNELYKRGRASSVRTGARALPDDTRTIIILDVDQPRPRRIIDRLIDNHLQTSSMITVPTFDGQRGHPTVMDGWLLPELRQVRERSQGLRGLLEAHESDIVEVPFDSEVVILGMNTPAEYEQVKAKYFAGEADAPTGFQRSKKPPEAGRDPGID